MGTQTRVLLATILSFAVILLWQLLTYKPQQVQQVANLQQTEIQKIEPPSQAQTNMQLTQKFEPYVVETETLKIVFNKQNAGIREVYVKEDNQKDYTLLFSNEKENLAVNSNESFSVKELTTENNRKIIFSNKSTTVEYNFYKSQPYFIEVNIKNTTPQKVYLEFASYIHSDKFSVEPNNVNICKNVIVENNKYTIVEKVNKLNLQKQTNINWVAVNSKYFLAAIVFNNKDIPINLSIEKLNRNTKKLSISSYEETKYFNYNLLFVPKKISLLTSLGNKFVHTVDWGTFAFLSKLFYNILSYFYKIFKNYGIAIIGLTIIIQIVTFPLTYNSIKSTIKIKKIQPQLQLLQKLYKDDPKRLNIEIMNLYREKKVNPFGGCLPLLLQIPIFWALFTMLRNTYDLRGASFILWIKDLSQPDKLVIPGINLGIPVLVLLMGATMFIQQFASGAMNEPQQKTMAIMMPVIFTILFFNFPSGLVLYWLINNIFSILIQIVVNKTVTV